MISTQQRLVKAHATALRRNAEAVSRQEAQEARQAIIDKERKAKAAIRRFKWRVRKLYWQALRSYKKGESAESTLFSTQYVVKGRGNAQFMIKLAESVLPSGWQLSLVDEYKKWGPDREWGYFLHIHNPTLNNTPAPVE